jgi:hypothetical protein
MVAVQYMTKVIILSVLGNNYLVAKRVLFFNKSQDELIRSIFYNRVNESIIVVSVTKKDDYNSLKCRNVSLELI